MRDDKPERLSLPLLCGERIVSACVLALLLLYSLALRTMAVVPSLGLPAFGLGGAVLSVFVSLSCGRIYQNKRRIKSYIKKILCYLFGIASKTQHAWLYSGFTGCQVKLCKAA